MTWNEAHGKGVRLAQQVWDYLRLMEAKDREMVVRATIGHLGEKISDQVRAQRAAEEVQNVLDGF